MSSGTDVVAEWLRELALPLRALEGVTELRGTLRAVECDIVRAARANHATWQEIGSALGISRQAAQRRWTGD